MTDQKRSRPASTRMKKIALVCLARIIFYIGAASSTSYAWSTATDLAPNALRVSSVRSDQDTDNSWRVRIGSDASTVEISSVNTPTRTIQLRAKLLPNIHCLGDGRHALMATRDGWILRLDLEHGLLTAQTTLGSRINGTALSTTRADTPQLLAVANAEPPALFILDEQLQLVKKLPIMEKTGRRTTNLLTIRTAVARNSFVAILENAPELWEVSYDPHAPEIGLGFVHDFQYREGQFVPGYLNPQRSTLPSPASDVVLVGAGHEALTTHNEPSTQTTATRARLYVTHLDVRRAGAEYMATFLPATHSTNWLEIESNSLPEFTTQKLIVEQSTLKFTNVITASHTVTCAVHQ